MNTDNTDEPEAQQPSTPQQVLLVPGHLFFVDRVDLPAALESAEMDDFAELSLENLAPFSVEQLYWGYLYSESAGSILLYASYKERIRAQCDEKLEAYQWVLPDFATLFGAVFPAATTLRLESEAGFSQIEFEAGDLLPQRVTSSPSPANQLQTAAEPHRIQLQSTTLSEKGIPTFHFQPVDSTAGEITGVFQQLTLGEDDLWRADIRDAAFKKNERSARKLTTRITRVTVYAALFALCMIMLEGLLSLGHVWLDTHRAKIDRQTPEVRRIEDMQSLLNRLEQIAQNELRPIAILEALNQNRPEGIYFTSTVTEGQNQIVIDGIANTINELNAYTQSLTNSGRFEMPSAPRTLTRGGQTTFTATLEYRHIEDAIDEEDPASSEDATEEEAEA